jgi:uncharacterized protein involved in outer membrane biogenesis
LLKKFAVFLVGLIVVVLVAVLVGPSFVDWNAYKPEITAAVEEKTGRKLAIDGAIDLQILPSPRLSVANARLSNSEGAADPDMVRLDSLQVHVALRPLLSGTVRISSVTLIRPVISLERFADGSTNWEFPRLAASGDDAPAGQASDTADGGTSVAVSLDGAEIIDGSVVFRDAGATKVQRLGELNTTIVASSLVGPFLAKGGLVYQGIKTDFDASLGRVDAGRPAAAKLVLAFPEIAGAASFEGTVGVASSPSLAGDLTLSVTNLREASSAFTSAMGVDANLPPVFEKPLEVTAGVSGGLERADVSDLIVQLGEVRLQGNVAADLAEVISVDAKFTVGRLDLEKFGIFERSKDGAEPAIAGVPDTASEASSGFTLPENIRVKLAVSADAIDHGGRTIRQLRVEGELDQGAVSVDVLTAQLPGGTNLTVTGTVYADAGLPRFVGHADVVSDNLRDALNWLEVPLDGLAADRLRKGVFRADIDASPKQVDLANWTVDVDNTNIGGGLTLLLRERPAFGLSLVVDKVNLDAYLTAEVQADAGVSQPTTGGAPAMDQAGDITKLLSSFDANLLININEARYRNTVIRGTTIDATVQSGEIEIRDFSVGDVGGAALKVAGKLAGTIADPSTDITVSVTAKSTAKLARLAGVEVTETIQKLGGFKFQSKISGSPAVLTLDSILRIAQARVDTKGVVKPLASPVGLDLALKFSHPQVENFLSLFGKKIAENGLKLGAGTITAEISSQQDKSVNLVGAVTLAGARATLKGLVRPFGGEPEIEARIAVDHPDIVKLIKTGMPSFKPSRRDLGPFSLKFDLAGGPRALTFGALSLTAGPTSFVGDGGADLAGTRPKISMRLMGDVLEVDPWLAPESPKPRQGAAVVAVPVSADGREWSRERIDLSGLGSFDGVIDLSAKKVIYAAYIVDTFRLKAELAGGRLKVREFGGGLFGGRIEGTGRLDAIGTPAAEMALKVENADIRAAALAAANKGQVSGILDYETQLSTRGVSQYDMVSALQGAGKIRVHDGSVAGIDLPAVSEQLKKLDGALDFLKLAQKAMNGGATPIDELTGTYTITDGVLRSDDVALSSKVAAGKTNAIVNLAAQEIDSRSRFWLSEHPNSPPIGVRHVGRLDNPRTILDVEKLQAYVLQRVVQRGVLRQFGNGKQPAAAPVAPVTGGEPAQNDPIPSLDKLKPRDALKGILKGLLN